MSVGSCVFPVVVDATAGGGDGDDDEDELRRMTTGRIIQSYLGPPIVGRRAALLVVQ